MSDHIAAARENLDTVRQFGSTIDPRLSYSYSIDQITAQAQAHATVAIAEQLEIANRIALIAARPGAATSPDVRAALDQISATLQ